MIETPPPPNPHAPQTKAALWRFVAEAIENEGFHYALMGYTSPESSNCDELDPELATLWREYLVLSRKIEEHVGVRP